MRLLQILLALSTVLLSQSCEESHVNALYQSLINNEEIQLCQLESEIVEQTINEVVKIYTPRPLVLVPQYFDESDEAFEKRKETAKADYYSKVDTNNLTICLKDSLGVMPFFQLIKTNSSVENQFDKFITNDTLKAKWLNISDIRNIGKAKVIPMDEFPENPWALENDAFKGWVAYSRIYFSPDKKTAAFIVHYVCGGLCGYGTFVEVERKDDKWVIINKSRLWVA